ncbi:radical SAM protein [bacterium]|nr:radical SAM protein [bacterium]
MTCKISLSKNAILRKEWFGCLLCNTANGSFYQFNEDSFEIIKELISPLTITELHKILKEKGFTISKNKLLIFLEGLCLDQLLEKNADQKGLIFFEEKSNPRKDCLASPASVTIYITNICSKACKHCVNKSSPAHQESEYSFDKWAYILKKLRNFGVCSIVITGGEPLLRSDIFDILEEASRLKFSISLLTDFDEISDAQIIRLKKISRLNDIQVSLDGESEKTHDFIRGAGSFNKAIRRMSLLKKHKIPYTISTTVNNRNINEIDGIVRIYKKYSAKYLYMNPLAPYGRAKEAMKGWFLSDEQLFLLGKKYLQLIINGDIDSGNPFWEENIDKINDEQFYPFKGALTAISLGIYNFSIGSQGECYLDSKMKSEDILYLGNALTDDIENMWHHPKLNPLRSNFGLSEFAFIDQSKI